MPPDGQELLVLTHAEVVGDREGFRDAWTAWVREELAHAPGLREAAVHQEHNARRFLLVERWATEADYDAWKDTHAAHDIEALFEAHGVRSATSRWRTPPGATS